MYEKSGHADLGTGSAEEDLSLIALRDKVVDCVIAAHGEYFKQSRAALGLDCGEMAVRTSAESIVKLAFQTVGASYDAPTPQALAKVVNLLSERSLDWGATPERIFEHHCSLMQELGKFRLMEKARINAAIRRN